MKIIHGGMAQDQTCHTCGGVADDEAMIVIDGRLTVRPVCKKCLRKTRDAISAQIERLAAVAPPLPCKVTSVVVHEGRPRPKLVKKPK